MMGANSNRVLHVDASNFPVYETKDLDLFQSILNNIVEDYESVGYLSESDKEYLKARLAIAIFQSAESGDRDYERLKQSAIEAVSAAP
jgi:hypothetical protein